MLTEMFTELSVFAKLTLFVGIVPLIVAGTYALRPVERTLALMRIVSLAATFAAMSGVTVGCIVVLQGLAVSQNPQPGRVYMGLSQALGPAFVNFGALTAAWLLVGAGILRRPL
jgi:hypothetical protein